MVTLTYIKLSLTALLGSSSFCVGDFHFQVNRNVFKVLPSLCHLCLGSSMVEHAAVNRAVVGSSPIRDVSLEKIYKAMIN